MDLNQRSETTSSDRSCSSRRGAAIECTVPTNVELTDWERDAYNAALEFLQCQFEQGYRETEVHDKRTETSEERGGMSDETTIRVPVKLAATSTSRCRATLATRTNAIWRSTLPRSSFGHTNQP